LKKLGQLFSFLMAFIWSLLPWKLNKILGWILATLWIDVFAIRKKVILENIQRAFPEMDETLKNEIAKASMVSLCRSFFDVIKIPSLTDAWIDQNVVFHGLDNIEAYKKTGKGVLFLTLHLGSGDLGAAVISRRVWPCTLISKRFQNKFLDQFWFSLRGRSKTEFIDAHSQRNAFDILAAIRRQRGVIFVLDQFMGKPYGVETDFFGIKTGTAYGLALFAKKTQLPVIPIYNYWDKQDKLHICFVEPVDLSAVLSENNEVVTNRFNRELEKIISLHPDQWMWVHKRWKTFE
jgi:Kdo2-lipid IVA lauroyltransferase/acyltransferase